MKEKTLRNSGFGVALKICLMQLCYSMRVVQDVLLDLTNREINGATTHGLVPFYSIGMLDLLDPAKSTEPFGFRDGISQPIIRGSNRFHLGANPIHVVEPGEFVLGYPDNTGRFPPTPVIFSDYDRDCCLPSTPEVYPDRFPSFASLNRQVVRDLGRNGSFLVIRQLKQDVSGFNGFIQKTAADINNKYGTLAISPEWVGARMVGRWTDGSSLIKYPGGPKGDEDNDFRFGADDPQGLSCPYGAHIRRANRGTASSPGASSSLAYRTVIGSSVWVGRTSRRRRI